MATRSRYYILIVVFMTLTVGKGSSGIGLQSPHEIPGILAACTGAAHSVNGPQGCRMEFHAHLDYRFLGKLLQTHNVDFVEYPTQLGSLEILRSLPLFVPSNMNSNMLALMVQDHMFALHSNATAPERPMCAVDQISSFPHCRTSDYWVHESRRRNMLWEEFIRSAHVRWFLRVPLVNSVPHLISAGLVPIVGITLYLHIVWLLAVVRSDDGCSNINASSVSSDDPAPKSIPPFHPVALSDPTWELFAAYGGSPQNPWLFRKVADGIDVQHCRERMKFMLLNAFSRSEVKNASEGGIVDAAPRMEALMIIQTIQQGAENEALICPQYRCEHGQRM